MRRLKIILVLLTIAFVLCLAVLAVAVVVLDNEDYRQLAIWSVERFTGHKMVIEGPFDVDLSLEPSLSAAGIRLQPNIDEAQPYLFSIGLVYVKVALKPLLLGKIVIKRLVVDEMLVSVVDQVKKKDVDSQPSTFPPEFIIPIFESVSLQNIQVNWVDQKSDRTVRAVLRKFTIDDLQDSGPRYVNAEGTINGNAFQIDGWMGALADMSKEKRPYPLELNLKAFDFLTTVSGTIDDPYKGKGLKLLVSAEDQDLSNLLNSFKLDFPPIGRINFAATLGGEVASPSLTKLELAISAGESIELSATGSIPDLITGEGTDIAISQVCRNRDILNLIFPENWQIVEEFRFKGTLSNVQGNYVIEGINAFIANDKGIILKAAGKLQFGDFINGDIVKAIDLRLKISTPQTNAIRPLLIDEIPEIGSVTAEGRLTGPVERLALEDLVIRRGGSGLVQIVSKGRIGWIPLTDDQPITDMDLDVSVQAAQSKILSSFYGVPIEDIGTVSLTGRVTGSTDQFQLRDLEMRTSDPNGLKTLVSGDIDFTTNNTGNVLGEVNLKLRITAPNLGAAEPLIGARWIANLGPVSAETQVKGTTEILSLEKMIVTAGKPGQLHSDWRGRIGMIPLTGDQPISDVNILASTQAAKTSAIGALFGISLPDFGPVKGSWKAVDRSGKYRLDEVNFVVGDGRRFHLKAAGAVDSIIRIKKVALDGIDLNFSVRAADTDMISRLLEMQIPNLGALDGSFSLSGSQDNLAIHDVNLTVKSSKGMEMMTTGSVGRINLEDEVSFGKVDVQLAAKAPNIAAVPVLDNLRLPELGPLQLNANVNDHNGSLDIDKVEIRAGPEKEAIFRLKGWLHHVPNKQKMALTADFETRSRPWLETYFRRKVSENPRFAGSLRLASAPNHLRIDAFKIATKALGGLSLQANGSLKNMPGSAKIDVQLNSKTGNPSAWGSILGVSLPPFGALTVKGRYTGHGDSHNFEGETGFGRSRFQTVLRGDVDHPRPRWNLKVTAPMVHLEDLGFYTDAKLAESALEPEPKTKKQEPLFDDTPLALEALQAFDLLLSLKADNLLGKNIALNQLDLDVKLINGQLQIDPSTVSYRDGSMSIEGTLDTVAPDSSMAMKIFAEDIDINDMLAYLHEPLVLEGKLNLAMDLHSTGKSAKEIAANLTGEFGAALENGKIQRKIEILASDALDFILTAPRNKTYTDLNCFVSRMLFEKGLANVQLLYLDTPAVRAQGAGSVNLASERIDLVINPTAKKRLLKRSSPVRIYGKLDKPSIKKIPVQEAAGLASQIFVPFVALPARALGYMWSLIRNDKDENSPCLTAVPITKP